MLPVSLVMGQSASAKRLTDGENYQIKCLQPGRTDVKDGGVWTGGLATSVIPGLRRLERW